MNTENKKTKETKKNKKINKSLGMTGLYGDVYEFMRFQQPFNVLSQVEERECLTLDI